MSPRAENRVKNDVNDNKTLHICLFFVLFVAHRENQFDFTFDY